MRTSAIQVHRLWLLVLYRLFTITMVLCRVWRNPFSLATTFWSEVYFDEPSFCMYLWWGLEGTPRYPPQFPFLPPLPWFLSPLVSYPLLVRALQINWITRETVRFSDPSDVVKPTVASSRTPVVTTLRRTPFPLVLYRNGREQTLDVFVVDV